jgi:FATC domain
LVALEDLSDVLGFGARNPNLLAQVERLIKSATLPENLSASYIGWCPFW